MIGLYATITVAVKIHCYSNIVLCFIQFSLIYKSTVITIILYRQIYLLGEAQSKRPPSVFQTDEQQPPILSPKIVRFDKENVQTHLGLYIMSFLKFLQDYPWQCSNTRYYSGLTLTLTEPKINFNLDTLPKSLYLFFPMSSLLELNQSKRFCRPLPNRSAKETKNKIREKHSDCNLKL